MSDLGVVPSLSEHRFKKETAGKWVNGNAIIQSVLQQLDAEKRKEIVLRCDEIPYLQGNKEDLEKVFSGLLQMILQKKSTVSTLFLHISCKTASEDLPSTKGGKWFTIQFHANVTPCFDWMQAHEQQRAEIMTILQKHNGSLEVAHGKAQGCSFFISLPGKQL